MMRILWILAFFGALAGASSVNNFFSVKWLFNARDETVTERSKDERSLCETKQCKNLAKILTESMNVTADPCEDFYEYACGNWKIHNPLPDGENRWNLLRKSQKIVDNRLLEILEQDSTRDRLFAVKYAKRAYKACMDIDEIEKRGLQPIVSTLWRIGGWPLIMEEDEWDAEIYKWQNVDNYYAHLIGLTSLFDIRVGFLDWNVYITSLLIDTPHLPYKMYKLLRRDEIDIEMDSSDENNDSREGSQERGSEEKRNSNEDEDDENDEDYEDEEEMQEKRIARKRISEQQSLKKRKYNKIKGIQKHINKQKKGSRTKREVTKPHGHNEKQHKQRKVNSHIVHRDTKKNTAKLLNHEQLALRSHTKKSVRKTNLKSKRKKEHTNSDIYFVNNDNEEESGFDIVPDDSSDEDTGRNNDSSVIDKNDGSGSGDSEWDDNDGSGDSGWDDDDNSGSDNNDDDDSGSGNNDDDDSGSGNNDDEGDDEDNNEEDENDAKEVEKFRQKYAEYMLNVSSALAEARGVPIPKERLVEDINELMKFQLSLLKIMLNSEDEMNTTLRAFQKSYDALNRTTNKSKIDWIKAVQNAYSIAGMEIDADINIGIMSFNFIKSLRKLLDETPSKTIVNYIHWNFLSRVIKATTKEMRDFYYNWEEKETNKERSIECIDELEAKFCLGYEYVQRHFSNEILETAIDMVDDIEKEVEHQVESATWMDDDTRHYILDKLVYLKRLIGYPATYRNDTAVREYFRGLSVNPSHYENKLSVMRHMKRQNLKSLFATTHAYEDYVDPLIVNAFYSPFENTIEITAADFQNPMFDINQPWYTNFGIIGVIIGHEINHGFDNGGRLFDKDGNYKKWVSAMAKAYEERADCYDDQYTRYSVVENRTVNIPRENYGKQTMGENIADSLGLNALFKVYERRQRECKKPDPMLPGLVDFTNEQLFFLSYANLWCEVVDPEAIVAVMKRDPHSLGPLRVIGPVSNSEDFAKAFNCPKGSPMNPMKKCNIWK